MKRFAQGLAAFAFAVALALLGQPEHAKAQPAGGLGVLVVSACGGNAFNIGPYPYITELQNGELCTNATGGGGPSSTVIVPSSSAATGIVPIVAGPSVNSAVLKAAPGNFYGVTVTPTAAVYIFLINATSLPANATLTPGVAAGNLQECVGLAPANLTSTFDFGSGPSEVFSSGITVALSSTACPVLTASAVGTINGRAQ